MYEDFIEKRVNEILDNPVELASYLKRIPAEPSSSDESSEESDLDEEDDPEFDWKHARNQSPK